MSRPKPCPFCGGEARDELTERQEPATSGGITYMTTTLTYTIRCTSYKGLRTCGARMSHEWFKGAENELSAKALVVYRWNRRPRKKPETRLRAPERESGKANEGDSGE